MAAVKKVVKKRRERKNVEKGVAHIRSTFSCLKNPIDRGVWQTTVRSCEELDTTEVT